MEMVVHLIVELSRDIIVLVVHLIVGILAISFYQLSWQLLNLELVIS